MIVTKILHIIKYKGVQSVCEQENWGKVNEMTNIDMMVKKFTSLTQ